MFAERGILLRDVSGEEGRYRVGDLLFKGTLTRIAELNKIAGRRSLRGFVGSVVSEINQLFFYSSHYYLVDELAEEGGLRARETAWCNEGAKQRERHELTRIVKCVVMLRYLGRLRACLGSSQHRSRRQGAKILTTSVTLARWSSTEYCYNVVAKDLHMVML